MNMKEKAANKILRQYYEPIKDKNENGCFSEFLSVKYDRMGKRAGDELLNEEPDANWKCKACNHKRQWSLECCFLAREQVAIDFDTNVFVPWSQRRNSSIHTPESTEPPSSLPSPDCDDEDTRIATRTTTRSRSEADDEGDVDLENNIKRQRMINELGQQELQTINLQIELMEKRNRLAQLQENET